MSAARILVIAMAVLVEGLSGAVIDQFSSGEQMVSKSVPSSEEVLADPVELSGSLFATRTMSVWYGVQSLRVNTTLGRMEYVNVDSGLPGNDRGYFEVFYQAAGPVDLRADGANAIRLSFHHLAPIDRYFSRFGVTMESNLGVGGGSGSVVSSGQGYTVDIPFADFSNVDLTTVTSLRIQESRLPEGHAFSLSFIETVPEPRSILLMLAAAPFLLPRRRDFD
ncbi:MAG: hypothetical protein AAGI48_06770 [Verrucomicrobiota bacterium]